MTSNVSNYNYTGESINDNDIHIITFVVILTVIICLIPCFIGKNGRIYSRDWFLSRR